MSNAVKVIRVLKPVDDTWLWFQRLAGVEHFFVAVSMMSDRAAPDSTVKLLSITM